VPADSLLQTEVAQRRQQVSGLRRRCFQDGYAQWNYAKICIL